MKNWIKSNIIQISVIILLIFVILLQKCDIKSTENVINKSEINAALFKQKNELETKYITMLSDSSKIIQEKNKQISDKLKPIIIIKEKKASSFVEQARKDTATTALCDSAINAQEQLIFDLDTKAYYDSIQISECNKQNLYKNLLSLKKDTIITDISKINQNLSKELKHKNNWFNRNKLYIGIATGFLGSFFILKN